MSDCPNRKDLFNHINEVSFAVDDIKLYLDTHPYDEEAMECFEEYSHLRNEALKEYAKHFGPLTMDSAVYSDAEKWTWISNPWPWQEGGC